MTSGRAPSRSVDLSESCIQRVAKLLGNLIVLLRSDFGCEMSQHITLCTDANVSCDVDVRSFPKLLVLGHYSFEPFIKQRGVEVFSISNRKQCDGDSRIFSPNENRPCSATPSRSTTHNPFLVFGQSASGCARETLINRRHAQ